MKHITWERATLAAALVALSAAPVTAQDVFTWDNATEFAFVTASGNASSSTLGLKSTLEGKGPINAFKLEIGGIRSSSNFTDRTAVGTTTAYTVTETTRTEKSAENYFARSRYDRDLGENSLFVFGGAGWERNTFAGFNHRVSLVAGIGDAFVDTERTLFKADIGGTYTVQKDISPTPGQKDGFGGVRGTLEFTRAVTETTDFESSLIADENLRDTEDLRLDWVGSISVSLTEGLAFKTSYRVLFDNQPAQLKVPLFDSPGGTSLGTVLTPGQKADTFLTLSLVIKL